MESRRHDKCKKNTVKEVSASTNFPRSGSKCPGPIKHDTITAIVATGGSVTIGKKASKLPIPIKKNKQNTVKISADLKGLSLADVKVAKVDASIGTESTDVIRVAVGTGTDVNNVLSCVKEESELLPMHLSLAEKSTFKFYENKLADLRGSTMEATVREISKNVISDEVLRHYSYLGQGKKSRFKDYDNITRLVVSATIESNKREYEEIYDEKKVESKEAKKQFYDEVFDYFTKEYIKKADSRYKKSK